MNVKIPCAIYTRKSNEEGLEQDFNSLDAQYESCRAYITSQVHQGWDFVKKYDDAGISGGTLNRPALKNLIEDIRAGKIRCIVVYKIDRLSRSLFDFAELIKIFDEYGVSFVSITQSFNTSNAMGKLMLNVLLSFAQFERELTGERIRDKISASKKKGIWVGGYIPLGYRVENKKLIPDDEEEINLVKLIFEKYLEIKTIKGVVEWLTDNGFSKKLRISKKGKKLGGTPFDKNNISDILKNPIYIGQIKYKTQHYAGEHKGIIVKELFSKVQSLLKEQEKNFPKNYNKSNLLLSSKLFCIKNIKFTNDFTKKGNKRYYYYLHKDNIRLSAGEIDNLVLNMLNQLFENIDDFIDNSSISLKLKSIKDTWQYYAKDLITKVIYENHQITLIIKDFNVENLIQNKLIYFTKNDALSPLKISIDKGVVFITLPITFYSKYGTTQVQTINPNNHPSLPKLIQGYKLRKLLESGKSISTIASETHLDPSYIIRLIKFSYSDLVILESILGISNQNNTQMD